MAHIYHATVKWDRGDAEFERGKYSRAHRWVFDEGLEVPASAAPGVVPAQFVREDAIDPEEALVAALSSCHMLTFLDLARRGGFVIDSYEDAAEGELTKNEAGRYWVSSVTLRPRIVYVGAAPDQETADDLHHKSHDLCFIANSIKGEVRVEPREV